MNQKDYESLSELDHEDLMSINSEDYLSDDARPNQKKYESTSLSNIREEGNDATENMYNYNDHYCTHSLPEKNPIFDVQPTSWDNYDDLIQSGVYAEFDDHNNSSNLNSVMESDVNDDDDDDDLVHFRRNSFNMSKEFIILNIPESEGSEALVKEPVVIALSDDEYQQSLYFGKTFENNNKRLSPLLTYDPISTGSLLLDIIWVALRFETDLLNHLFKIIDL